MTLEDIKEEYKQQFAENDCKYIVLKVDDLMDSINSWNHWEALQYILELYNRYRESKGKGINKYFVANRDDYPWDTAEEFIDALNNFANIAL